MNWVSNSRRPSVITDKTLELAKRRLANGETASAAASIGVRRATLYRHIDKQHQNR